MHQAMRAAATRAFTEMFLLDGHQFNHINQFIELTVSRHNLTEDAIRELSQYTQNDYKKPLKVKFLFFYIILAKYVFLIIIYNNRCAL